MKARENYLLDMLSNNDVTFFIPPYQRNYEWDKNQCSMFLEDIIKTAKANINGGKSEHFFGTIVYVQNEPVFGKPNKLILTDGQQRITTTMLFLIALRDIVDDNNLQNVINSRYLKNDNITSDTEYKIKLKQVETDWKTYSNVVLGLELTDEDRKAAIYKNLMFFKGELNKIKKDETIPIINLVDQGLTKFSIVTIQLEPEKNHWENPQEIFESMNSLGKPLSLGDLVRNYLLMGKNANVQDKLYKDYWLAIERNLSEKVSDFIRDFMQLEAQTDFKKATTANYKELYAQFKNLFKGIEIEKLMIDLSKYSNYYACIVRGKNSGSILINKRLTDIKTIGVTIANSLLLSLFNQWDSGKLNEKDFSDILDALIIYFLRRRILKLTQGENKSFPPLVKEILTLITSSNKKICMFNILSSLENFTRLPNDNEVVNELRTMNFYNFNQAKFILTLIEEQITKSRPDKKDKNLQIEHIMPQTLNNIWIEELEGDYESVHQEYIHNIGNLTLIRHNQVLGNKSFYIKKEIYKENSGLQIAKKEIINRSKWNKNSIQKRSKWITQFIVEEVIPIPDEKRYKNNYEQKRKRLSFSELNLIGEEINYISDKAIKVNIVDDRKVIFEGKKWFLSPLTKEIETRKGTVNKSGAYQGAQYWEFEGIKLAVIM
jgi:uncharacterized protein with ParB-like and HNH nuclease domain